MLNTEVIIFYKLSITLVISAFMVIMSTHSVFSLLFLVSSFIISAFLLFLIECEILALLFVVVYVGAIAVLFLFAVMMLETKFKNLFRNVFQYLPLGFLFIFSFFYIVAKNISENFELNINTQTYNVNNYYNWFDFLDSTTNLKVFSQILYSYFALQFLFAGLILLVVLIGVIYLTSNYNISDKIFEQSSFKQLSRNSSRFLLANTTK